MIRLTIPEWRRLVSRLDDPELAEFIRYLAQEAEYHGFDCVSVHGGNELFERIRAACAAHGAQAACDPLERR